VEDAGLRSDTVVIFPSSATIKQPVLPHTQSIDP